MDRGHARAQRFADRFAKLNWPKILNQYAKLVTPQMQDACIADLFVTCGQVKSFCLMNMPPFYHTDHDTLDRISDRGIRNAVNFHFMLLQRLKLVEE